MLIDVSACCDHHANHAIDELFAKAASDGPGDPMEPHHSPFIQRLIELFHERGLMRSGTMKDELDAWLAGEMHTPSPKTVVPPGYMERWSAAELKLVKLYLESLPPASFALNDWMMVIEYLTQRYWPADELRLESEWLASRATIMGKVQGRMAELTLAQADKLLAAVPAAAATKLGFTAVERGIMDYGAARCTEAVVSVVGAHKQALKQIILDYQRAQILGDRSVTFESLQTKLLDRFGVLNADWRRLAITEAGENANQGIIASLQPGARVRRLEQYRAACGFCRKIDGMVLEVVAPDAADKDDWTQVWVGKTNVGRSAAPRKKTAEGLVDRTDAERWAPPAGTVHPHCRGTWQVVHAPDSAGDSEFSAWMQQALTKK
jgi:hypothetical protein